MITYYINFDGRDCTVFESQIFTLLSKLKDKNCNVKLINFEKNNTYEKNSISEKFDTLIINKIKKGSFFEPFYLSLYVSKLGKILNDEIDSNIILHCRGHFSSYIALKAKEKIVNKNIKVISDFRGMAIDEYTEVYKEKGCIYKVFFKSLINKIKSIERYTAVKSDYIYCVTNKLKKYLTDNYKIDSKIIDVIPTCVEMKQKAKNVDKVVEGKDKFVVVYSGGAQIWQCPDKIMETFLEIKKKKENAFLLILSKNITEFEFFANKHGLASKDYKIISCKFNEVDGFLKQADVGLLLRENTRINNVASPTKFAEYMINNIPVILSHNIGDLDDFIKEYRVGFYPDDIDDIDEKLKNIDKSHCKDIITNLYLWDNYIDRMINNNIQLVSIRNRS